MVEPVTKASVRVGKPLQEQHFVEESFVWQLHVGEQPAVIAARVVILVEKNGNLSADGQFCGEVGGLGAEIHHACFRVFCFGCVNSPEANSCVVGLAVGDINVEGVTIDNLNDGEGFAVIFCEVLSGGLGLGAGPALPSLSEGAVVEPDHKCCAEQTQRNYGGSFTSAHCVATH